MKMFYEEEQIRNVLSCEKCNKRLDEPRILSCGACVCTGCISSLNVISSKYQCPMCQSNHIVPIDGFPVSKKILNLLAFKPNEIPRTESVRTLQTTLNEIQNKINDFTNGLNSGIERIKEYCLNLKADVQLGTNLKIQRINELNEIYIREINSYEKECIDALERNKEDKEYFNRIINDTSLFKNDWSNQLKRFEISDATFFEANQYGLKLIKLLDNEKNRLDDYIFDGNRLRFESNKNKITSDILGSFVSERISMKSAIFTHTQMKELMGLCGFSRIQRWKLLYRASNDGFSAKNFHDKCDGKRNTLTVIKTANSNIFGGYVEEDWSGNQLYKNDPNALLFSLVNREDNPLLMKCIDPSKAIFCSPENLPVFGRRDLVIRSNSNISNESYSNLGSSFKHPEHMYQSNEARSFLAGNYKFQTAEIEVFCKE